MAQGNPATNMFGSVFVVKEHHDKLHATAEKNERKLFSTGTYSLSR